MFKNLIVYAHPYDKSFNHAILAQVQDLLEKKGQTYELIDLYGTNVSHSIFSV